MATARKIPSAVLDSVEQVCRTLIARIRDSLLATIRDLNLSFQNNSKRGSPSSAVINQFDLDQRKEAPVGSINRMGEGA